jgi:hypothetical protein
MHFFNNLYKGILEFVVFRMKRMKLGAKIILGAIACSMAVGVSIPAYDLGSRVFRAARNIPNPSIQPYVERNLVKAMKAQEKKLGIKHFGMPKIKYGLSEGDIKDNNLGLYFRDKNTIELRLCSMVTPEGTVGDGIVGLFNPGDTNDVKPVLDHELGHFYADKLNESLGGGDWPDYSGKSDAEKVCLKLVSEGIAEYFERSISGEKDNFEDSEWPKKIDDFWGTRVLYSGGYHLVKPIIDAYGKEGIEYLMKNPPTVGDLKDLPKYQQRSWIDILLED